MIEAATVFWLGVALDLVGLLLVAAGDYWPLAIDFGRAVRGGLASAWRSVSRLLRRSRGVTHTAGAGGVLATGGDVTMKVSPREDASLEELVEFLLRRVDDLQKQHQDLAADVAALPRRWTAEIAAVRAELEQRIERRLTETQERYLRARRLGLVCLLVGNALIIGSNVLS